MVWCDGGGDIVVRVQHKIDRIGGGDVLEHDFEPGEAITQGQQHLVDKAFFALEHIHVVAGDFTMHQQRHAAFLHGRQRVVTVADIGDAFIGIGGGARRVQLHRLDEAAFARALDFIRAGVVGEIQRHQRLERAVAHRLDNAVDIGHRLLHRGYRRFQIGHDNGAGKLARGKRRHRPERIAIAQVQVPVVGAGNG